MLEKISSGVLNRLNGLQWMFVPVLHIDALTILVDRSSGLKEIFTGMTWKRWTLATWQRESQSLIGCSASLSNGFSTRYLEPIGFWPTQLLINAYVCRLFWNTYLSIYDLHVWVLLKCIHFSSKVYPHKFIMDEQSIAWGRMRAGPGDRKVCVDHLQKDMVSNHVVFFC